MKTVLRNLDTSLQRTSQQLTAATQADTASTPSLSLAKRLLFIALAGLFFVLGGVGIFLPGLPTTPFLLLTSYFLLRAWPRMNERLLRSRLLGGMLRDWQHRGGVRRHTKLKAIVIVGLTVCAGLLLFELPIMLRSAMACGALAGLLVIRRLPEVLGD